MSELQEFIAAGDDDLIDTLGETVTLKRNGAPMGSFRAAVVPAGLEYQVEVGGVVVQVKALATVRGADISGSVLPGDRMVTGDGELLVVGVQHSTFDAAWHLTLAL